MLTNGAFEPLVVMVAKMRIYVCREKYRSNAAVHAVKKIFSKKMIELCILVCVVISLSMGCAGHASLSKKDKESIQSVGISGDITRPSRVTISLPKHSTYNKSLFQAFSDGLEKGSLEARFTSFCNQSGIDIGEIVREQFEDQLKNSGAFDFVQTNFGAFDFVPTNSDADAELVITILSYGFVTAPSFIGSGLKPVLSVRVNLVKADGTIIWSEGDYITAFNKKTPGYSLARYNSNPDLIEEAFTAAAKIVCGGLVDDMSR
jgi:hypothetical protein